MAFKDKLPFLRRGQATIRSHRMKFPHWEYFFGIFYEIFVEENYRINGLTNVRHIIDAGSNTGISVVYFAQTYPEARIDCFEPNPEALPYLQENVASYKTVSVHPFALGEKKRSLNFYVDAEIRASSMASSVNFVHARNRPQREIPVEMRKLSEFINTPVDILKVDIEGGEMGVMEDLVSSGKIKHIKNILMEFHYDPESLPNLPTRMFTLLEENGFFFYIRKGAMVTVPRPVTHGYMIFAFRK